MTTPDHSGPARPEQTAGLVFDDPLERRSADDLDEGWGERIPDDSGQGDLVRFLREKPPHHI
ncbi:hypothetical protein [Streptomyces sp. RFCAC02]|uniref:hypothetical protein n=1 Tax=Streptomyces sp. RFCAC02 TaxID=2499143 RepID=UPI001F0F8110|nr:hypothetical protein [Streptomyces sp. RFCAC02]